MGHEGGNLELVPAARRLMTSLRDMGYEFTTAIADLVDNSIEAGATTVSIDIEFEGESSWVRIADNGSGMTSASLREAMRYGSSREYRDGDLGKFGLGLKVASLSQCQRLTVASRTNRSKPEINAYCWDLAHIESTNRWELLSVATDKGGPPLFAPLKDHAGTVVLWQRLDRVLGYQQPEGESARRRLSGMSRDVEGHLAMVFHRLLAGEADGRRKLTIKLNGRAIIPWDPFAREEKATKRLDPASIKIRKGNLQGEITFEPFILPQQSAFSNVDNFRRASGPGNWNQQQGLYVYRADRLIQSGGWCRIRTIDEHTKLARVAMRFSPALDDAFRVNVSKMRVQLPSELRDQIAGVISPVTKIANEMYRSSGGGSRLPTTSATKHRGFGPQYRVGSISSDSRVQLFSKDSLIEELLAVANDTEKRIIRKVAARLKQKRTRRQSSH